ncbi:MAG: SPOR domain-containing protein [Salibacteraceae bacterium]
MKKFVPNKLAIILAVVMLSCTGLFAQNNETTKAPKEKSFLNNLSVSPSIGLLHGFTDLAPDKFGSGYFMASENKLGYGLNVNYDFLNVLRLSAGILGGKLRGSSDKINTLGAVNAPSDLGYGIFFQTNILELTFPKIDLNVTKLIFKDRSDLFNSLSLHLFLSQGLVYFDSKIYATEDESVHLLYGKHRGQSNKTTEAVTSFGMDLSYRLNDRFDVNLGSVVKYVWNDRLDAWETPGSSNDYFSYTSVGVTFYIKNRNGNSKKATKDKNPATPTVVEEVKKEPLADSLKPKLTVFDDDIVEKDTVAEVKVDSIAEVKENDVKDEVVASEINSDTIAKVIEDPTVADTTALVNKDTAVATPSQAPEHTIYSGKGNFIIVAAFQTLRRAKIGAAELKEKGEVATIVKNRKNTLYLISIGRFDDRQEALTKMRELRRSGKYKDAWVFYNVVEQ